jgi:nitrite reductase (NO-forming)
LLGAGIVTGAAATHAIAHGDGAEESTAGYESHGHPAPAETSRRRVSSELLAGSDAGPYGGPYAPPASMRGGELDGVTFPPPAAGGRGGAVREYDIAVVERPLEVSLAHTVTAWTYNGTVPGPTIRATEGDLLRIRLVNATNLDHNLHFHGRHSPLHDGWEPVPPGGEVVYEIEAGPAGLHPYHCHTMPVDLHVSKGLYGALIVDPPGGRPDAHEVLLLLSGWDPDEDGRNDLYTWNGVAGFHEKFPIKFPVGEPVRVYLVNAVEYDPVASFHLHAETFDVFPAGMGEAPAFSTDIVTLGQMDRAILEFRLSERGRYMFHPHQHGMMSRGAMGWFAAI